MIVYIVPQKANISKARILAIIGVYGMHHDSSPALTLSHITENRPIVFYWNSWIILHIALIWAVNTSLYREREALCISYSVLPIYPHSSSKQTRSYAANCTLWFHCGAPTMVQDLLWSIMKQQHIRHISAQRLRAARCKTSITCQQYSPQQLHPHHREADQTARQNQKTLYWSPRGQIGSRYSRSLKLYVPCVCC